MKNRRPKSIGRIFADGTLVDQALAAGANEAIRQHRLAGLPVAVWRDGKVVWIPADQIKIPNAPSRRTPRRKAK